MQKTDNPSKLISNRISDIDIAKDIKIGDIKIGKKVPVYHKDGPIIFQTPLMEITGPIKKTHLQGIYQLDTLFTGDTKKKMKNLFNFIDQLEDKVSSQVEEIGEEWFPKNSKKEIKSFIRIMGSDKKIMFIKWIIDLNENIFYDSDKNLYDYTNLREGDLIKLIVEISHIWINDNQFGFLPAIQKIRVEKKKEAIKKDYDFIESESEDEDDPYDNNLISLIATEQKPSHKNKMKENFINQIDNSKKNNENMNHLIMSAQTKSKVKTDTKDTLSLNEDEDFIITDLEKDDEHFFNE